MRKVTPMALVGDDEVAQIRAARCRSNGVRAMKIIISAIVFLAVVVSARGALADNYGAIAYSSSTGSVAWSYDFHSRGGAENDALQRCARMARDCEVAIWFVNSCGALAVGSNGATGHAWATNRSAAEANALGYCRGSGGQSCSVTAWTCTTR